MDYTPEDKKLTKPIPDHLGDFKTLEEVLSKLTEKLNLTESQVASIRKTLIKAEEEAQQVPPLPSAANLQPAMAAPPSSKSKRKKMKKQASKQQTQAEILDPADVETIEAMEKEIATTVEMLKIVQHLHKVLLPTRDGAGQVRAAAGKYISGQVKAAVGNKIRGQVRARNIISEQVRAGNIGEQAGLRKHVGHRWE